MKTTISSQTLNQIIDKKSRDKLKSPRYAKFNQRYDLLIKSLEFINKEEVSSSINGIELRKYYPIAIIACLEDYMRLIVKDLIDYGEPYVSNLSKLENIDLKLDVLIQMKKKNITIGEIIAHTLPFSSIDHIFNALSKIGGDELLRKIKTEINELTEKGNTDVANNYDDICKLICEAFRLRHIYAHELNVLEIKHMADHIRMMSAVSIFTYGIENIIEKTTRKF
jgi:hypothetical protein